MPIHPPSPPADKTYSLMPAPGEMDPKKLAHVARVGRRFRLEAGTQRNRHIGTDSKNLAASENLYRFGREDGHLEDSRPTVNRVKKTLDHFEASANRTPASIVLKSISVNSEATWVMQKPYVFHAPVDPQTGQPQLNPATGQPFQDIQFNESDRVPEEILEFIPAHRRLPINTETVLKWEQATFDAIRLEIDYDDKARKKVHGKQIIGWFPHLFEWDPIKQRPRFKSYPPQQWYLDPIQSDVEDMNRVGLDMVVDAAEAARLYPQAINAINRSASKSVKFAPGSIGYSPIYIGDTTFATPVVTMGFMWLRNVEVPMNLDEALETGLVMTQEDGDEPEGEAESGGVAGEETAEGSEDAQPDETEADDAGINEDDSAEPGVKKPQVTHTQFKAIGDGGKATNKPLDLTDSFDQDGKPSEEVHPQHPRKLVTVQWIEIDTEVVPGTYIECPHWDIPISLDKNSEILFRPYGDPDTVYLKSPQYTINAMYAAMVSNAEWFKGPTGIMSKELSEKAPDGFESGFANPGKIFTIDLGGGDSNFDINKHYLQLQPPSMTQAQPEILKIVTQDYERIADAGVNNGTPPPGVTAHSAIASLQAASQSTNDLKSMHTEKAIRRDVRLWLWAQQHWMSMKAILKLNKSISPLIVEKWIMPFRKEMLLDAEVNISTGGGLVKQQKDSQTRADFQLQLIDEETAQDALDYDSAEIARRKAEQRKILAEEQADAMQKAAPPQQPPQPPENIAINYKDAPPDIQRQMEQRAGFQASTVGVTVDHTLSAAKIQNEANRTTVDAQAKQHAMAMNEQQANKPEPQPEGA